MSDEVLVRSLVVLYTPAGEFDRVEVDSDPPMTRAYPGTEGVVIEFTNGREIEIVPGGALGLPTIIDAGIERVDHDRIRLTE